MPCVVNERVEAHADETWAARPKNRQYETFQRLAAILLLTYALHNADCHAKNIALLYTSRADVHLSPAYDFLTTSVYAGYQYNPPGISVGGKKTWTPGKNLSKFIAATFGIPLREQSEIVERISDSVADVVPVVREKVSDLPEFTDTGKRMLLAWQDGVNGLRDRRVYSVRDWPADKVFNGISDVPRLESPRSVVGGSPLLGGRSKGTRNKP